MTNVRTDQMSDAAFESLASLDQDVLLDLWDVDLRKLGGEIHRFCNIANETGNAIIWQGNTYERYPIKGEGFEMSGQGAASRPKITVSNVMGFVTGAVEQYNQMMGAVIVRHQVCARFLDAVNFTGGNTSADPLQEIKTKFIVERMVSLTSEVGTFELAVPSESDGSTFPCRIMMADRCGWQYRGEGCGYTGGPVADEFGMPTNDKAKDRCGGRPRDCQARYGLTAVLPYGGWPSISKLR